MTSFFFFFNDTATTEIYTLSLHDALPISCNFDFADQATAGWKYTYQVPRADLDRKSTRLNSSHSQISYAVFCLKKKKKNSRADLLQHIHTLLTLLENLTIVTLVNSQPKAT